MIFDNTYSCCAVNQRIVVSSESGNKHILNNNSGYDIFQFHVDGGIIKDRNGERCDFIVEVETDPIPSAYVIELKGSDLNKAIRQILSTVHMCGNRIGSHKVLPRIIIHKVATHDVHGKTYRDFRRAYPQAVVKVREYSESV